MNLRDAADTKPTELQMIEAGAASAQADDLRSEMVEYERLRRPDAA